MELNENRLKIINEFLDELDIKCNNIQLLNQALTHSSYTSEKNLSNLDNYERLEFLGDAVLKIAVSEYLYETFPDYSEGQLSKIRSIVVSDAYLAKFAENIGVGACLNIGPAEERQGGRSRPSNLACAFEAILGALYLDGKFSCVKKLLVGLISKEVHNIDQNETFYNPKAILQEHVQAQSKTLPEYILVTESGPAHKKNFTVEVRAEGGIYGLGEGYSKKEAQQKAAFDAIQKSGILEGVLADE